MSILKIPQNNCSKTVIPKPNDKHELKIKSDNDFLFISELQYGVVVEIMIEQENKEASFFNANREDAIKIISQLKKQFNL